MRDIVSTSGTELDHIVYDSFGNIVTETNATNGDRFKFAGMEYDATAGQYYDRARWYGSGTGRSFPWIPLGLRREMPTRTGTLATVPPIKLTHRRGASTTLAAAYGRSTEPDLDDP